MAFISNASGITLGEGTFNNIQGNLVNISHSGKRGRADIDDVLGFAEPERKRRREDPEGLKVIRHKHLNLAFQIGRGPGYLLHSGKIKGRAVIVKVFNAGKNAREQLDATAFVSQGLLHPNVLRIEGISSPTSMYHFIAYQDAHRKTADGPLAAALRNDLDKSILLGFKMISDLSSGIDYLSTQGITLPPAPENFDVFLDTEDRFLFSIDPPTGATPAHREQEDTLSVWALFNALCQKVLRSANRVLYDEDIERTPTIFDSSPRLPALSQPSSAPSSDQLITQTKEDNPADPGDVSLVPPRREFVWRAMDVPQPLATIAARITRDLDMRRASIHRLVLSNGGSIHRCPGYIREEVTLAVRTADSAVISHDAPTVQEVCSVCHEVVNPGEVFRCVCGQREPGLRSTFKCRSCKSWSHRDCDPTSIESICSFCPRVTSSLPRGGTHAPDHRPPPQMPAQAPQIGMMPQMGQQPPSPLQYQPQSMNGSAQFAAGGGLGMDMNPAMQDVDTDAPFISMLDTNGSPLPPRRVKLLVKDMWAPGQTSSSRKRRRSDDNDVVPSTTSAASSATAASAKRKATKRKPRKEEMIAAEEESKSKEKIIPAGAPANPAPTQSWFEASATKARRHVGQMGTVDVGYVLPPLNIVPLDPPVADMSTFLPTMAPLPAEDTPSALDMVLSAGFWDSMLVPGYNSLEGLNGGFVFGSSGYHCPPGTPASSV